MAGFGWFGLLGAAYGVAIVVACGWLAFRRTPPQFAPPEPTRSEARALILGTGSFWALWGLTFGCMTSQRPGFVAVLLAPTFAAGAWLFIGGIGRLAARMSGMPLREWVLGGRPRSWRERDRRLGYVLNVGYYGRAAKVLGWSSWAVFSALGALLTVDLVLFVARSPGISGR